MPAQGMAERTQELLRQRHQDAMDEAMADRAAAVQAQRERSPTMKHVQHRTSTLQMIPFFGPLLQLIANLLHPHSSELAYRQRLERLPTVPRSGLPARVALGRHAKKRFPGFPGKMSHGIFRAGHGKPNVLSRRRVR